MVYDSEWRTQVHQQLAESAKAQQQTAIILERLSGQITEYGHRIDRLEGQPTDWRTGLTGYGGCVGQLAFAALSLGSFMIMLVSIVIQHWK